MPYIIVRNRPVEVGHMSKDELHHRRKFLEGGLKETIFSKDKMEQRDCKDEDHENKRTKDYDLWKKQKLSDGTINENAMAEWSKINKQFKKMGEENRLHTADQLRDRKAVKHD